MEGYPDDLVDIRNDNMQFMIGYDPLEALILLSKVRLAEDLVWIQTLTVASMFFRLPLLSFVFVGMPTLGGENKVMKARGKRWISM